MSAQTDHLFDAWIKTLPTPDVQRMLDLLTELRGRNPGTDEWASSHLKAELQRRSQGGGILTVPCPDCDGTGCCADCFAMSESAQARCPTCRGTTDCRRCWGSGEIPRGPERTKSHA